MHLLITLVDSSTSVIMYFWITLVDSSKSVIMHLLITLVECSSVEGKHDPLAVKLYRYHYKMNLQGIFNWNISQTAYKNNRWTRNVSIYVKSYPIHLFHAREERKIIRSMRVTPLLCWQYWRSSQVQMIFALELQVWENLAPWVPPLSQGNVWNCFIPAASSFAMQERKGSFSSVYLFLHLSSNRLPSLWFSGMFRGAMPDPVSLCYASLSTVDVLCPVVVQYSMYQLVSLTWIIALHYQFILSLLPALHSQVLALRPGWPWLGVLVRSRGLTRASTCPFTLPSASWNGSCWLGIQVTVSSHS